VSPRRELVFWLCCTFWGCVGVVLALAELVRTILEVWR
jgi:hypothetical protein